MDLSMSLNYSLSFTSIQTMLIYQPDPKERIVWHGGESTQLHYEINRGTEWKPMATTTIYDFPTGVKELLQQFQEYYDYISPEVQGDMANYDY